LKSPIALAVILLGIWFAINRLHLSVKIDDGLNKAYQIFVILNITWVVSRVLNAFIQEYLVPYKEKKEKIDEHIVKIIQKTINTVVWIFGIVISLGNVGINIGALVAGLGIGGIAFALAAQDTIKNIFAGVIIFIDRPFKLGERIKIENIDGFVEDIGLRSVRIRTLDKRLLTISSSRVIDSVVENVTQEPARRIILQLGLVYNTTPDEMKKALDILKSLPSSINGIEKDVFAFFNSYGDFSLNIKFIYYIKKNADIFETESEVNLKILQVFNQNNLKFAYPTSTLYIEK
jgi:MscS family membrane protein